MKRKAPRPIMRDLPKYQLDPKVKSVWRLSDALAIIAIYFCCSIVFWLIAIDESAAEIALPIAIGLTVIAVIFLIIWELVAPPLRYKYFRYEISPEYLYIAKGIIWRKRYIVPFIRVQNTDTRQGPIARAFGLASVNVSTAASAHVIPGLSLDVAEELRDRAAEFARLAKEDV